MYNVGHLHVLLLWGRPLACAAHVQGAERTRTAQQVLREQGGRKRLRAAFRKLFYYSTARLYYNFTTLLLFSDRCLRGMMGDARNKYAADPHISCLANFGRVLKRNDYFFILRINDTRIIFQT